MNQVKLNELIKSKMINIPVYGLRILREFNLTNDEMLLLLLLYNSDGDIFNPNLIAESLNMELLKVMKVISSLSDKGLISVKTKTNESKRKEEVIDLNGLYEKITIKMMEEMNKNNDNKLKINYILKKKKKKK